MVSRNRYSIILFSILIVCLLAVSSKADYSSNGWTVDTMINGTVNGGVFYDSVGWDDSTTRTLNTDVPNGTVKYAYLYTGVWGNGVSKDGWVNVTFNGDSTSNKLGPIHLEGESDSNNNVWCTGLGKHWFWYNVTDLVNTGQINTATTSKINDSDSIDGRVYGIVLVVVYEGGDDPKQIQYWINNGSEPLSSTNPTGTTNFVGTVSTDNVAMANLTLVHLTGYDPSCSNCMKFNGNELDTSCINTNFFDMHTWSVTNYMNTSGNDAWFSQGSDPSVNICNAILTVEYRPDLVVSNIYPQYIFTNLTNVLSVNVMNQGTASTASCDVNLTITHTGGPTVLTATVPVLNGSESAVVEVGNWKPTVLENISITAFADSGGVVDEGTKEGNNNLIVSRNTTGNCTVDDMLPDTCYGYRGDNSMTTAYEGIGGVIYSVGDFKYKNNTVNFSIEASGDENQVDGLTAEVPAGATIKNATLYVYYTYRKSATGPNPGADPRPDYEMSINGGSTLTTDEYYTDIKGFTTSEYQYGTLVYDVTDNVTGNGAYQAVRSNCNNTDPTLKGKGYVSGMALMIIYDDGSDNTYAIAHGYDRLATYYSTQYKVLPEDATTTTTLTDVDPTTIAEANLFTVTVDAVAPGSESQQFNNRSWEVSAWQCVAGVPSCNYLYPLGINRSDVDKNDITASGTDEVVKFQERTSNGFAPVFTCLQTRAPDSTPPGNGGGGGGSSSRGGASGENYANIETSETEREYLSKGSRVTYNFDSEDNFINSITFTPLSNSGKVAVKVEILKSRSSLADSEAPDEVFINLNIWAGSSSWATSEHISDPEIKFEVERSWIKENNIVESTIKLYRFSDEEWKPLETTQIDKNENCLCFKAKTPGFSPFAITGKTSTSVAGEKDTEAKSTESKDDISTQAPEQTSSRENTGSPGFGSIAGICMLLIAILILHRQKI